MAITGAIFKSLSFDGVTSREYGVYITGEAVFNAPEREVDMISIPGRNGDFAQDKGRFQNIEVTYPAGIFADNEADFAKAISEFRNFLCSRKGYCRLTDEYNPDEYRMAVYKNGLEVDPKQLKAGEFEITFDCQPQRYLLSGEEPIDISGWTDVETETGQTVTIDALGLKSFSTPFEPSQDGTPWITNTDEVAPYLFRSMPQIGQDYDSEVLTSIIGGSVAWNQLVQNGNFADTSNWSATGASISVSSNIGTIDCTGVWGRVQQKLFDTRIVGQKYFLSYKVKATGENIGKNVRFGIGRNDTSDLDFIQTVLTSSWQTVSGIINNTYATEGYLLIGAKNNIVTFDVSEVQFIDLTALFGSAQIADYVYSLEQTTAGVAWLKSHGFIDGKYHAYDAGSLKSVKTSAHETVGKNLLPAGASATRNGVTWTVKDDGTVIASGTATADSSSTLAIPIPQHLDGDYYFLGCAEEGSGAKWNAYIWDYTTDSRAKKWDGTSSVDNSVDLTTRRQVKLVKGHITKFQCRIMPGQTANNLVFKPMIINSDVADTEYEPYVKHSYPLDADLELRGRFYLDANNNLRADGDIYLPSGEVERVYGYRAYQSGDESLTDAITDGTNTVYKLSTPTTETADPYQEVQIVDNYGTEQFIDTRDVQIPVGHASRYGEVYAINGWDEIGFSVASGEDQTDYTLDLDGTRYGGNADIISGDVELTWGHTDDYNGETLTGRWLSDRDVYAAGTSPSIGAEVAYELSTPQTVQVTPVEVDLYDGDNTLSSDTGKGVTVEYGTPPGMIYNPTLFGSSPLIITEGYGDIHIGSDTITLNSAVIGKVKIGDANQASHLSDTSSVTFSLSSSVDTSLLNDGDDITLDYEGVTILKAALSGMNPTGHSITSKTGIITTASTQSRGTDSVAVNSAATGITFSKGTSQTKSGQVIARVVVNGENVTATTNISVAFNGSDTISISASISVTGYYLRINQTELGHTDVYGDSTVVVGAGERYIDLDIGEAYMIENGQIISVDSTTALPPELPTLKPGETEITHDNTITELSIVPRWWKV